MFTPWNKHELFLEIVETTAEELTNELSFFRTSFSSQSPHQKFGATPTSFMHLDFAVPKHLSSWMASRICLEFVVCVIRSLKLLELQLRDVLINVFVRKYAWPIAAFVTRRVARRSYAKVAFNVPCLCPITLAGLLTRIRYPCVKHLFFKVWLKTQSKNKYFVDQAIKLFLFAIVAMFLLVDFGTCTLVSFF